MVYCSRNEIEFEKGRSMGLFRSASGGMKRLGKSYAIYNPLGASYTHAGTLTKITCVEGSEVLYSHMMLLKAGIESRAITCTHIYHPSHVHIHKPFDSSS